MEYLEHVKKKREAGTEYENMKQIFLTNIFYEIFEGLGYWDDSPRFMGESFAAVMKKTMMWGVHPTEDRLVN